MNISDSDCHEPTKTEIAILKTVLYGDIFDFPLTLREIHHFLIEEDASIEAVQRTLENSEWLSRHVVRSNGYYATRAETADLRHHRAQASQKLWQTAHRYGILMAYLPYVRMVALTGALAMHNAADDDDDLDYMIVTAPGRVWFTRLLVVALVRIARLWRVEICPNYMLSTRQLGQERRNLYIAHELTQMVPVSGHDLYEQMRTMNQWADSMMPNAQGVFHSTEPHQPHGFGRFVQRSLEWVFSGGIGNRIENWERRRKTHKFELESEQNPHSAAVIDEDQVKGHFNDYGHPILNRFYEKLDEYGIEKHE